MSVQSQIKVIEKYICTDGEEFSYRDLAEAHQESVNAAKRADKMLQSGATLYDALRECVCEFVRVPEVFKQVTKDTKLIVSHWQCRDTPGYQPTRIHPGGVVLVYGDAGSWSGSCGRKMNITELERHVVNTFRRQDVSEVIR